MNGITAAVVGLGVHGMALAGQLGDAGIRVRSASDPRFAGQNLGDITQIPALADVQVAGDSDSIAWGDGIDIAILAAKVPVAVLADMSARILRHGVNVITIVEDAFDLQRFAPEAYQRIHEAAIEGGASFTVTGSQDTLWAGLVLQMSSQARDIRAISLTTHLGVDGYPEEFLTWCGIGNTPEQFDATAATAAETPSVFGAVLPVIADALGLTIVSEHRVLEPYTVDRDLKSLTFGRTLRAGSPVGRRDVVTLDTAEGIELRAELVTSAVMGDDSFAAHFDATPGIELRHHLEPANLSVDAALINRIPDVIAAAPGVVKTTDLPTPRYRFARSELTAS